jgi:LysR family nitrogen assimilation transcriptional regulator
VDTRHLQAFLKIAECGSVSKAAEALGMAQPSLSQLLLRLEDEVGAKLFRRTARGVTTTDAGRIFEEHAPNILQAAERALDDVRRAEKEARGEVRFAVPVSVSLVLGVPLVEAVRRHAPHVSLRLVEALSGSIRSWLDEGSIDLGILYDPGPLRHLTIRSLATEELYLIGPPGAFPPLGAGNTVPLEQLGDCPLILPTAQPALREFLEQQAARLGVSLTFRTDIEALAHISRLVGAGYGYSMLTLPSIEDDLMSGRISAARIAGAAFRRTVCLARNPSRVVTAASVRVEDLIFKIAQVMVGDGRWKAELDPER